MAAAAAAGPTPEPLRQGLFGGQASREPSPEPPRPPRSPWGPPQDLGRLLRSLSAPGGRAVPPPPGFAPRRHGAPPGLARPATSAGDLDPSLLALAALSLGPELASARGSPGPALAPPASSLLFPALSHGSASSPASALSLALLSPTSHEAAPSSLSSSLSSLGSSLSSLGPPLSPPLLASPPSPPPCGPSPSPPLSLHGLPSSPPISLLEAAPSSPLCRCSPSPPSSPPSPSPLYKTELCRPFAATGRCRYGARCQFAHGPGELRGLRRHPKYRTQPCSTFLRCGSCPYGPRCHFLHGPPLQPGQGLLGDGGAGAPAPPVSPRRLPVFDRISVSE